MCVHTCGGSALKYFHSVYQLAFTFYLSISPFFLCVSVCLPACCYSQLHPPTLLSGAPAWERLSVLPAGSFNSDTYQPPYREPLSSTSPIPSPQIPSLLTRSSLHTLIHMAKEHIPFWGGTKQFLFVDRESEIEERGT